MAFFTFCLVRWHHRISPGTISLRPLLSAGVSGQHGQSLLFVDSHWSRVGRERRKSPAHRYRWLDRIWFQDQCALEFQSQSCQCRKSCLFSIRTLWPKIIIRLEKFVQLKKEVAYFESFFENLLGFRSTHGTVDGNLFVTTNTERSHSVASFGEHWLLASQLFQHFRGTGQSVAWFAHTDVQTQFPDTHLAHLVLPLVHLGHGSRCICSLQRECHTIFSNIIAIGGKKEYKDMLQTCSWFGQIVIRQKLRAMGPANVYPKNSAIKLPWCSNERKILTLRTISLK